MTKTRKYILHMMTPQQNVSPFDVNMAYDAGFDAVVPLANVTRDHVKALVQDAIFSRAVADAQRTGVFICGKDAVLALDMLEEARAAMVPPFEISVFPDPAGSFTTAAAMVACAEKTLLDQFGLTLKGLKVKIYGGKGIVGSISGVICAQAGAEATIIGYDGIENVRRLSEGYKKRFGVEVIPADGSSDALNTALLADADVVFCAARAGVQVLSKAMLATAPQIKVVADANAVPPAGIEGCGLHDDNTRLESGALAIGPLTFGDVKIKTQRILFESMCNSDKPLYLNFEQATEVARKIVNGNG